MLVCVLIYVRLVSWPDKWMDSWISLFGKNFSCVIFSDDINMTDIKLCMMVVLKLSMFVLDVSTNPNSINNISVDISLNGRKLEEVTSFKYLGASLCKDGTCSAEVCIRIASAMAAMARLNGIWRCNTISFTHKFKLYKSLVTSILRYGCETWTLLADSEKRIQAFKTKCKRKLLRISYMECRTSNCV